jgi:fumarylacetoacetate (FAA) hydrolase family protein
MGVVLRRFKRGFEFWGKIWTVGSGERVVGIAALAAGGIRPFEGGSYFELGRACVAASACQQGTFLRLFG